MTEFLSIKSEFAVSGNNQSVADDNDDRNIRSVVFGEDYEFDTWYPCEYYFSGDDKKKHAGVMVDRLYVCNKCFKYTTVAGTMGLHLISCSSSFMTPGRLAYQYNDFSIREVAGDQHKLFCQCLSLFANLFVGTKSVHYTVEKFKFYILIHHLSAKKEQIVGFFSKEKLSWDDNNLACILIFPPFQGQGLGQMLIEFSYQISLLEGKIGSPEKPLSDHGRKSYLLYWKAAIARALPVLVTEGRVTINKLASKTSIKPEDVVEALKNMNALQQTQPTRDGKVTWSLSSVNVDTWMNSQRIKSKSLIDVNCIIMP
ncbi:acyl-CoA N-acyltransferase [Lipomyces japonicus]|uniref:acyl-CoA N-acyltransferase n=1 Tax=Lipomyces japonicus TaxID=56871 RepID=UPI0034CF84AC